MYRIEKKFTLPIGHRLSKNKGRCFSLHGHNIDVYVGLKAETLDDQDMIIDFSELKKLVFAILDEYDHTLLLSSSDKISMKTLEDELNIRVKIFDHKGSDPTAERLSEQLFNRLDTLFRSMSAYFYLEYVTVYENENSKATYSID